MEGIKDPAAKFAKAMTAMEEAQIMPGLIGTTEIRIDDEHVSVPLYRFEELMRSETELEILLRAYQRQDHYQLEYILQAVFGPRNPDKPNKDDDNA